MKIKSINPATHETLKTYPLLTAHQVGVKIELSQKVFQAWARTSYEERAELFNNLAEVLKKDKHKFARLITAEMGKIISASEAEIEKCIRNIEFYAKNSQTILLDEMVKTEASKSYVTFQPLGIIFAIMPWNYPFWQVIRFAAPALMAGNVALLKHASQTAGSSLALEEIFNRAGFPKGVFQSLLIKAEEAKTVIEDPRIKAVTLTGSSLAGSSVARIAGSKLKKTVLELGGSDPFIVLDDAKLEPASENAVTARLVASGQSCIAAKRFIVQDTVYDEFLKLFKNKLEQLVIGDPLDPKTQVGPLANKQGLDILKNQVDKSVKMGAKIVTGGKTIKGKGFYFEPTILTNITKDMPVYRQEVFGPVAIVLTFKEDGDALKISNDTDYGLGASVWTTDPSRAKWFIKRLQAGSVFINAIVKSDPRLPFGGIKNSGYGRELSSYGIKEFTNIKTVWMEGME